MYILHHRIFEHLDGEIFLCRRRSAIRHSRTKCASFKVQVLACPALLLCRSRRHQSSSISGRRALNNVHTAPPQPLGGRLSTPTLYCPVLDGHVHLSRSALDKKLDRLGRERYLCVAVKRGRRAKCMYHIEQRLRYLEHLLEGQRKCDKELLCIGLAP